tara:strand:- start:480 stop:824 length:345 start_codon:yes stop_codon:yes gene_type:complete
MKLTGKALEEFEKWYANNPAHYHEAPPKQLEFGKIDVRCQWGVYQDWADRLGYVLNTYCNASGYLYELHRNAANGGTHLHDSGYEANTEHGAWYTNQEARNASVDKLNELINEN